MSLSTLLAWSAALGVSVAAVADVGNAPRLGRVRDSPPLATASFDAPDSDEPAQRTGDRNGEKHLPAALRPLLVGHRGLLHHAPENTLTGFAACLDMRIGFELDVRRSSDGHLVCLHDEDVRRTTGVTGKVAEMALTDLRRLDAGRKFDSAFAGERIPTLEEVFALLAQRRDGPVLVALDFKIGDATVEADVVRLAKKHVVLRQVVCIGRAISEPAVRRRLRAADAHTPVAVLCPRPTDLPIALADRDADWVYIRFVPSTSQVAEVHRAGKRVFLVGPAVSGREPANWRQAQAAGVDAILTDYPLECRESWRSPANP
jgi:glycerophosphoryl diester phosphodiesterase